MFPANFFWYKPPNDVESVLVDRTWEGSTKSSQIILHHSDVMLYQRLDCAISEVLSNWKDLFEDQHHSIIERTARQLQRIMTRNTLGVCVDVTLVINHVCDGGILIASDELSMDGMVPASKSSIEMLELMKVDERNIKDECMVCLDEIGKESEVLCLPCSHMFHGECILKWLEKSHYCPLCRFEMPTD
ncbi:hypothetical protein HAX54_047664 [Datura stramonium]|uniref:RING-type E3 ubiquitin transferase n=1 Tax=Datura stramonium TaxID=4076 RepID=A0ABS8ST18_DATST|nr:hypothetical protein [Datura stramonium]